MPAAREQFLEILGRRIEVFEAEVDDAHEPQRVGVIAGFVGYLVDLAQRIVVAVLRQHQQCEFHARLGRRLRIVADQQRDVIDGAVGVALQHHDAPLEQLRPQPAVIELDRTLDTLGGLVDLVGLQRRHRNRVVRIRGILVGLREIAHDLVRVLRVFLGNDRQQVQQFPAGLVVALRQQQFVSGSRRFDVVEAQLQPCDIKQRVLVVRVEFEPAFGRLQREFVEAVTRGNLGRLPGDLRALAELRCCRILLGGLEVVALGQADLGLQHVLAGVGRRGFVCRRRHTRAGQHQGCHPCWQQVH